MGQFASPLLGRVEGWLEAERDQVALWAPVGLGVGIAAWFALPGPTGWLCVCLVALLLGAVGQWALGGKRIGGMMVAGGLLACCGCLLIWGKALALGEPPLARPVFTLVDGRVLSLAERPADAMVRVMVEPVGRPDLPGRVRLNIAMGDVPAGLGKGARIRARARLMPPAPPAVPGAYDFAQRAYFQGIGATGRALAPVEVVEAAHGGAGLRARLSAHVRERVAGPQAGIAVALATGDQGAIAEADAEAMRRSGLAHLLSISGLHVTALVGAIIFMVLRLAALSQRAALHWPLMMIAAGAGALGGVGYTLLTGAEVPTVRSCIAALLVLGAMAMGREAITLRLVATGALIVLLFWPEAVVGPSFQMSFAAVMALVALGELPAFRAFAMARDEPWWRRGGRAMAALLLTGVAVELALMPIALFHFHQAGMLGALANLIAIPLTTFVVMPFEALALAMDGVGAGAPAWWVVERALGLLLWVAHHVSASPMAVVMAPAFGAGLFAVIVAGGLWLLLWKGRVRWWGIAPVAVAMAVVALTPPPDVIVTGDGRHVALRLPGGGMATLRPGAGEYVRNMMAESAGYDGVLAAMADLRQARCDGDLCAVALGRDGAMRLLATRSGGMVPMARLRAECAVADIVVSDRTLPRACRPRWLKLDRRTLARSGGVAITLAGRKIVQVWRPGDRHPWIVRRPGRAPRPGQL
ncbi:competence protein ComEC [Sphingobium fontiphilum]|uniref:Competence protein ComEC n=1 Tax=Sphingobium fontiphilum TaxID=944425 RepID=A0A7W6DE35_9SPHN|nr:ComEC/Rec2 family competence protein [Sphingobium fontiphilum]MBB3980889.1 competence protein ComEC [Sphingobium fontiphilum]